jgi:hypothetical protein
MVTLWYWAQVATNWAEAEETQAKGASRKKTLRR